MPIMLLLMISVISLVISFIIILGVILEGQDRKSLFVPVVLSIFPLWIVIFVNQTFHYEHATSIVFTKDNTDYVIINDSLINLNREFGRDFEEGEILTFRRRSDKPVVGVIPTLGRFHLVPHETKVKKDV